MFGSVALRPMIWSAGKIGFASGSACSCMFSSSLHLAMGTGATDVAWRWLGSAAAATRWW